MRVVTGNEPNMDEATTTAVDNLILKHKNKSIRVLVSQLEKLLTHTPRNEVPVKYR